MNNCECVCNQPETKLCVGEANYYYPCVPPLPDVVQGEANYFAIRSVFFRPNGEAGYDYSK